MCSKKETVPLPKNVMGPLSVKLASVRLPMTKIDPPPDCGRTPVPCNGIRVGEVGALLVIVTLPENGPGAKGVKIVSNVAVVAGRMFPMLGEVLMSANGSWV